MLLAIGLEFRFPLFVNSYFYVEHQCVTLSRKSMDTFFNLTLENKLIYKSDF